MMFLFSWIGWLDQPSQPFFIGLFDILGQVENLFQPLSQPVNVHP